MKRIFDLKTVLVGLCVVSCLVTLMFKVASGALTAVLCLIGFLVGGISFKIGLHSQEDGVEIDSGAMIAICSALALGPLAAGPAAMTALGRAFLKNSGNISLRRTFWNTIISAVQAAACGLAFQLFRGNNSSPATVASIPAVISAVVLLIVSDRLANRKKLSAPVMAVSFGAGYGLAAAMTMIPPFAILAVLLPFALVLLGLLKRTRRSESVALVEEELPEVEEAEAGVKTSFLDPLTGLANQRYLEMFLQQEISRCERSSQPMTVLLIDIDDFDKINSKEGDEAADLCLAAIGSGLRRMLREYDVVGRYKDDEFIVVLPEAPAMAGYETAARLHSALSGQILPFRATFSIGVATYPTYGTTVDDLISSAHHALNRAKFSGKNSIRSCHELAKAS